MSDARIAIIKARINERDGKPGYKRNLAALKSELAKLEMAKSSVPSADPQDMAEG